MSHFGRSGPPDIADTYSLLILNISFRTTADDLFPLFDKYGKVVDIFIPKDRRTGDSRGFAFARYKYPDEAQNAVDSLDGRQVDGREITVQFAKYGPNAERIHRGRIIEKSPRSRDTVMIIGTEITGGEVAVGAGTDMRGTMAGTEVISIEAGVVAIVQTMADPVVCTIMMLTVGVGAGLLKVSVLEGAYHLTRPLLGVEALLVAAHRLIGILGTLHHVVLIRSDYALHT